MPAARDSSRRVPGGLRGIGAAAAVLVCVAGASQAAAETEDRAEERSAMMRAIELSVRMTRDWTGKSALDPRVMAVMAVLPRHAFVPPALSKYAYLNRPLPVGHGQKVSQPYIVALMTDLARLSADDRVLILGMGGGYHAAIAAKLAREVRCVEMFEPVAEAAMRRLVALGFDNVQVRVGDPYFGWAEAGGGFDAIIVRQAMDEVPRALLNQLGRGGRLVMPLGRVETGQNLVAIEKRTDGRITQQRVLPVLFTRMPGGPRI